MKTAYWLTAILTSWSALAADQFTLSTNNGTLTITEYTGSSANLTIPDAIDGLAITTIGPSAFNSYRGLTSIVIGTNVTSIGAYAFYGCPDLATVTIASGAIGDVAFYACPILARVTLENHVSQIGAYAFSECPSLTTMSVGSGITNIGYAAFINSLWLSAIYFGGNAPQVDNDAFSTYGLTAIYFLPNTAGWGPFFGRRPTVLWNPQIQKPSASPPNPFGFTINSIASLTLVIEACTNLANPNWIPVATNTTLGGTTTFSDPESTNQPKRFYRVRSP